MFFLLRIFRFAISPMQGSWVTFQCSGGTAFVPDSYLKVGASAISISEQRVPMTHEEPRSGWMVEIRGNSVDFHLVQIISLSRSKLSAMDGKFVIVCRAEAIS